MTTIDPSPTLYGPGRMAETAAGMFLARYRNLNTRRSYEASLLRWFEWCFKWGLEPLQAQRAHIEAYARWCEMDQGLMLSSVCKRLDALAGFYKYAHLDGVIAANPMAYVGRPKLQRESTTEALTKGELRRVIDYATPTAERPSLRDHALVCLLGLNGLRISEVLGIDMPQHFDEHRGVIVVQVTRKGGKTQQIPLAPETAWAVRNYKGDRNRGPLFTTKNDRRLTRSQAARDVGRIAKAVGITKRISPHSFRHAFVTIALDAGINPRDIQNSTGHADPRMISYYDRNREAIERNATFGVAAAVAGAA